MLKLALRRAVIGLPWGIVIALLVSLVIAAAAGAQTFSYVAPAMSARFGTELEAAAVQTLLCGLLGMLWGALSVIWQIDAWSLLKQTAVFFILGLSGTLTVEWLCGWVSFDWPSLLRFLGIFAAIFAVVWLVLYRWYRLSVRRLNENLRRESKR